MADLEFVNPSTGVLGAYAFGTVAAGTESAAYAVRLRYRWGQSGSGLYQNAVLLEVSEDGGSTWRSDLTEFTLQVTATVNTENDPDFYGTTTSARRTTRLDLPPLRAGCAYDLAVVFSPTLRTGAATTAYSWRLGVKYNESFRAIDLIPDAPTGVLTGIGDETVSEWVTVPTMWLGTGDVTFGPGTYVLAGALVSYAGGTVTLNQTSSTGALTAGQEYTALLSFDGAGAVTVTKGARATAGSSVAPTYPEGELPYGTVLVPYGGVIVTAITVAADGRLILADGGGLVVLVGPGRATMPGLLLTPQIQQSITVPDDATSSIYLGPQGAPSLVEGVFLGTATAAGGVLTWLTYEPALLYGGRPATLITDLAVGSHRITGIPLAQSTTASGDATAWGSVLARPAKTSVSVVADSNVATLSGEQTVDGVALVAGDRVLLTSQTDPTENGKWTVAAGAWERSPDCSSAYHCPAGAELYVRLGTYGRQKWIQTSDDFAAQIWEPMVVLP